MPGLYVIAALAKISEVPVRESTKVTKWVEFNITVPVPVPFPDAVKAVCKAVPPPFPVAPVVFAVNISPTAGVSSAPTAVQLEVLPIEVIIYWVPLTKLGAVTLVAPRLTQSVFPKDFIT